MGDSSDEEINFDDEVVDLAPLWRDSPFICNMEPDEPEVSVDLLNDDNDASRVIELTPTTPSPENDDPLQTLINEITNMSWRVNNARIARQRLLDLGRPTGMVDEADASTSNQQPMWSPPSIAATRYPPPTVMSFEEPPQEIEDEQILYRFSQLRHLVAGATPVAPRWSHGRQTFSAVVAGGIGAMTRMMEPNPPTEPEDEVHFDKTEEPEHHFILPKAIEEREKKEEMEDSTRADRAIFVSDLVLSTLTKRSDVHPRSSRQSNYATNNVTKQPGTEKNNISGGVTKR